MLPGHTQRIICVYLQQQKCDVANTHPTFQHVPICARKELYQNVHCGPKATTETHKVAPPKRPPPSPPIQRSSLQRRAAPGQTRPPLERWRARWRLIGRRRSPAGADATPGRSPRCTPAPWGGGRLHRGSCKNEDFLHMQNGKKKYSRARYADVLATFVPT